jgi:hypothetical protein
VTVVLPHERREPWCPQDSVCWYCGDEVAADRPAVLWVGETSILLHPDCARSLGDHLIGDARECKLATGQHPWGRRAARAAGNAMRAQERTR